MIELMDVYDSERRFTGEAIERGSYLGEGRYFLYAIAIVQNLEGKILVTQRSQEKSWAAGWWEVQGGGVGAGEDSLSAVSREVTEEAGLCVEGAEVELLYSYRNDDAKGKDNYFTDIFRFRMDFSEADVTLQQSEAVDFRLLDWEGIKKLNENGTFLHFSRVERALMGE